MTLRRYWIQQIQAIKGQQSSKPIFVVATHADKVTKGSDQRHVLDNIVKKYSMNSQPIKGPFVVSLATNLGVEELKQEIVQTALEDKHIGIKNLTVPAQLLEIQKQLQQITQRNRKAEEKNKDQKVTYFMSWAEFEEMCFSKNILLCVAELLTFLCLNLFETSYRFLERMSNHTHKFFAIWELLCGKMHQLLVTLYVSTLYAPIVTNRLTIGCC